MTEASSIPESGVEAQASPEVRCDPGHACNPATGLCEPLPCEGRCKPDERCERSGIVERCVPATDAGLGVERRDTDPAD